MKFTEHLCCEKRTSPTIIGGRTGIIGFGFGNVSITIALGPPCPNLLEGVGGVLDLDDIPKEFARCGLIEGVFGGLGVADRDD